MHISVKLCLIGILFVPKALFGQFNSENKTLKVYDTLAIIETVQLQDSSIKIRFKDLTVMFDKNITVETIRADIEELKADPNLKNWQTKTIIQFERVADFISHQNTITLTNFWTQTDTGIPFDEIKDDELLTKKYLWELVCPMLDSGKFILLYKNQEIRKIIKTRAGGELGTAVYYLSSNGEAFWVCPPITID